MNTIDPDLARTLELLRAARKPVRASTMARALGMESSQAMSLLEDLEDLGLAVSTASTWEAVTAH